MYPRPMTAEAERLQALAAHVEARIGELGLEYATVARTAGFSDETLSKIRKGVGVRPATYRKLEIALLWEARSVQAVLVGGQPTPVSPPTPAPSSRLSESEETLRRITLALAREYRLKPRDVDEVMRLVRQDLEDSTLDADGPDGERVG